MQFRKGSLLQSMALCPNLLAASGSHHMGDPPDFLISELTDDRFSSVFIVTAVSHLYDTGGAAKS